MLSTVEIAFSMYGENPVRMRCLRAAAPCAVIFTNSSPGPPAPMMGHVCESKSLLGRWDFACAFFSSLTRAGTDLVLSGAAAMTRSTSATPNASFCLNCGVTGLNGLGLSPPPGFFCSWAWF